MILVMDEASQVLAEDEMRRALRPAACKEEGALPGTFDSLNLLRVLSRTSTTHTSVGNTKIMEELITDI